MPKIPNISRRTIFLLGLGFSVALILSALYFQHVVGLVPCDLCIFQRVAVIGMGLVFLAGAVHNPRGWGWRVYAGLMGLVAATGAGIAGRQVWLQSLPPDQLPGCGPGLDYLLDRMPFTRVVELVFQGSGDCAEVQWTFLGLSMPAWMLVIFIGFTVLALVLIFLRGPWTAANVNT